MHLDADSFGPNGGYRLLISTVLPRPIAWVSSRDAAGRLNLAPFSFFTVASADPMTLIFCPQQQADGSDKHTLRNIEAVGEFVVNIPNLHTVEVMNASSAALPEGDSEFEFAGVTPAESVRISVPRVAEAPVAFECRLQQVVRCGTGAAVFGQVACAFVRDELWSSDRVDTRSLAPVGRLAGADYVRVSDVFRLERPVV